ncbi:MAG: hypothetical protein ACFB0B_14110 [Thermonemataceae bacterium]
MKKRELKDVHHEDLDGMILLIERSFEIEFIDNELSRVKTFGELLDAVKNKISLKEVDDCTTQQAFYKLRDALSSVLEVNRDAVLPRTLLTDLLPVQKRRTKLRDIEKVLGYRLNILELPNYLKVTFIILFLLSLFTITLNWWLAILGAVISIIGLLLTSLRGSISVKTVGELVKKMTRENYMKSRRNVTTFNKSEIERVMIDLFSEVLEIEKERLTSDAKLQ